MKIIPKTALVLPIFIVLGSIQQFQASESNGLAPEITDLNAKDISYKWEATLPYLKKAYISTHPPEEDDGIKVAQLDAEKAAILTQFAHEIAAGEHGLTDSLLVMSKGKLIFESYFRRGRLNMPHYQMSITKSYTALAVGRAIQLGYLSMDDLDKSIVSFLKEINPDELVPGAETITLAQAMNMKSGIRIDSESSKKLIQKPASLRGQGQVEAYLKNCAPIPPAPREFKYQAADPAITIQVLEAVLPGSVKDFIHDELLTKMGIKNYAWQTDISGLPKSAAGSSIRSRDMLKWGKLIINEGRWQKKQLLPKTFVLKATDRIHTNQQGTSYGFFFWRHNIKIQNKNYDCISGRGAGGQFILMFPDLDLLIVTTAHNKGMGKNLKTIPERVLPLFSQTASTDK